uniref:Uncharacterized protein n=1 Tax=Anopheles stephensi TaxID=30069 RepID=A0A182YEN5_ANOST
MNSYFEQTGFYGHPHQAAAGMMTTTGTHHDQTTAAAAAAYRGFPLSLGMSPYTNHHLHQTRTAQESPYDASIQAASPKTVVRKRPVETMAQTQPTATKTCGTQTVEQRMARLLVLPVVTYLLNKTIRFRCDLRHARQILE